MMYRDRVEGGEKRMSAGYEYDEIDLEIAESPELPDDTWLAVKVIGSQKGNYQYGPCLILEFEIQEEQYKGGTVRGKLLNLPKSGKVTTSTEIYKWFSNIQGRSIATTENLTVKSILGKLCMGHVKKAAGDRDYYNVVEVAPMFKQKKSQPSPVQPAASLPQQAPKRKQGKLTDDVEPMDDEDVPY